jgi:hypothetical protein
METPFQECYWWKKYEMEKLVWLNIMLYSISQRQKGGYLGR